MRKTFLLALYFLFVVSPVNTFAGFEHGSSENNDNIDNSVIIARIKGGDIEVTVPSVIFTFTDTYIKLNFNNPEHTRLLYNNNKVNFIINGEDTELTFVNGEVTIKKRFESSDKAIKIYSEEFSYNHDITPIALWHIIVPIVLLAGLILFGMIKKQNKTNS
jgi:uncharacterized protein YhbP (UPF0306 family)